MGPIDYTLNVQNPVESLLQGVQGGMAIRQMQDARTLEQQNREAQKQALAYQNKRFAEVSNNKYASEMDYVKLMTEFPHMSENIKRTVDILTPAQQQKKLYQASQVHSAVLGGNYDVALSLLEKQKEAALNSGNTAEYEALNALLSTGKDHPEALKTSTGVFLTAVLGPGAYAQNWGNLTDAQTKIGKQQAEIDKAFADAGKAKVEEKNAQTDIELGNKLKQAQLNKLKVETNDIVNRFGLEKDKLETETQLKLQDLDQKTNLRNQTPEVNGLVNESVLAAIQAGQSADMSIELADQIESSKDELGGWKGYNTAAEWFKAQFGDQDKLTQLRNAYSKLVTQSSLAEYKKVSPGPQTDRDAEIAMRGVPADTAKPEVMAEYLRAMARIQRFDAVKSNAKSEWIATVGSLGRPKTDVEIDGVQIPAGTSFVDFSDQYFKAKAEAKNKGANANAIQGRGYLQHATGDSSGSW